MLEIYIEKDGYVSLENMDDLIIQFPEYGRRALQSAIKSEGYRLKKEIQNFIRTKGGGTWPDLNPHTGILKKAGTKGGRQKSVKNWRSVWRGKKGKKRRGREYWSEKGGKRSTATSPLLKLVGGIRYEYDKETSAVSIGFVNPNMKLSRLAAAHADGFTTPVTPRFRRFLFALGFPVKKSTTELKTPKREIIGPVFEREKASIAKNIEAAFFNNMERYMNESKSGHGGPPR